MSFHFDVKFVIIDFITHDAWDLQCKFKSKQNNNFDQ